MLVEFISKEIDDFANRIVVSLYTSIGDVDRLTMRNLITICDNRVQRVFSFSRKKCFEILTPIWIKSSDKLEQPLGIKDTYPPQVTLNIVSDGRR